MLSETQSTQNLFTSTSWNLCSVNLYRRHFHPQQLNKRFSYRRQRLYFVNGREERDEDLKDCKLVSLKSSLWITRIPAVVRIRRTLSFFSCTCFVEHGRITVTTFVLGTTTIHNLYFLGSIGPPDCRFHRKWRNQCRTGVFCSFDLD